MQGSLLDPGEGKTCYEDKDVAFKLMYKFLSMHEKVSFITIILIYSAGIKRMCALVKCYFNIVY